MDTTAKKNLFDDESEEEYKPDEQPVVDAA